MVPVGEHSAKPVCFLEMIERFYPTLPKIELYRRGPAKAGWDAGARSANRKTRRNDQATRVQLPRGRRSGSAARLLAHDGILEAQAR